MKYFLSACAIVRNESAYIAEWLEFHVLQGVEHFFIYENGSTDNTAVMLKPYIEEGLVTLINYPGDAKQVKAYQHCLDTYGKDSEWIAFLDADEFLYNTQGASVFGDFLPKYSMTHCLAGISSLLGYCGGIAVHWELFGSNGHTTKTDGLVIERFTKRNTDIDKHVKSIVKPACVKSVGTNPHCFYFKDGYGVVLPNDPKPLSKDYAIREYDRRSTVRINHYHVKSVAEYRQRKLRCPDANSGRPYSSQKIEEQFRAHDLNQVTDTYLKDNFAKQINEALAKRFG